ncbi:MAG: hypothetical protein HYX61_12615 [Gammaproteobacteria bacterium]|jgi:hypothetical protein|nr:hypothetical protein [Gammaproteobacteria bacterium]
MKNAINSLQVEYFTLADLAIIWNLTIDQLFKAASQGKIKIGIMSNGWVVQPVTRKLALFDYTSDFYSNDEITALYKNGLYENNLTGDKRGVIQEPFSLLPEDLLTLHNNGLVKTFAVMSFDTDDYLLIQNRSAKDLRYRHLESDALTFSTDDIENLILTKAEKERCEREYQLNSVDDEILTEDKNINISSTIGLFIHLIAEKMTGYKTPSGPNISQIAYLLVEELAAFCDKHDFEVPRGFSKRALETRLNEGLVNLGTAFTKTNLL